MDSATARMVVMVGAGIAAFVWLLGLKSYGALTAEPTRFKKRVPVRSSGPEAFAELVRWAVSEGRQIVGKGDRHLSVRHASYHIELTLIDEASGPALEVKADLSALKRKYTLLLGAVVLLVAPALIVGLAFVLYTYAAPSSTPGVRGQVFQIAQVVHVLWPPLAFCGQYRRMRQRYLDPIGDTLSALIDAAIAT